MAVTLQSSECLTQTETGPWNARSPKNLHNSSSLQKHAKGGEVLGDNDKSLKITDPIRFWLSGDKRERKMPHRGDWEHLLQGHRSPDSVAQTASPAIGGVWEHGLAVDLALIGFLNRNYSPIWWFYAQGKPTWVIPAGFTCPISQLHGEVSSSLGYFRSNESPVPGGNSAQDKSPTIQRSFQISPQTLLFYSKAPEISISWDEAGHTSKSQCSFSYVTSVPVEVALGLICPKHDLLGCFISSFFIYIFKQPWALSIYRQKSALNTRYSL